VISGPRDISFSPEAAPSNAGDSAARDLLHGADDDPQ
jgi:hypothetical protein